MTGLYVADYESHNFTKIGFSREPQTLRLRLTAMACGNVGRLQMCLGRPSRLGVVVGATLPYEQALHATLGPARKEFHLEIYETDHPLICALRQKAMPVDLAQKKAPRFWTSAYSHLWAAVVDQTSEWPSPRLKRAWADPHVLGRIFGDLSLPFELLDDRAALREALMRAIAAMWRPYVVRAAPAATTAAIPLNLKETAHEPRIV